MVLVVAANWVIFSGLDLMSLALYVLIASGRRTLRQ